MQRTRREFLRQGSRVGWYTVLTTLGCIRHGATELAKWNKAAFASTSLDDILNVLGAAAAVGTDQITLGAPDIAENGAVVPLGVASKLPNTEAMAILIEQNPNLLAAHFILPADTLPEVHIRVKMAKTSPVYVLVQAEGKFYFAKKNIEVILGGCGD